MLVCGRRGWVCSWPLYALYVLARTVIQRTLITFKPILALWLSAEPIFMALKQDPEVAYLAAQYLRWVSWGLPAYCFNSVARYVVFSLFVDTFLI